MNRFEVIFIFLFSSNIWITCNGQNYVERQSTGDTIFATGLDCTLHKAISMGGGKCFCGSSTTYYTDQNGVTGCFRGRGEAELGKVLLYTNNRG